MKVCMSSHQGSLATCCLMHPIVFVGLQLSVDSSVWLTIARNTLSVEFSLNKQRCCKTQDVSNAFWCNWIKLPDTGRHTPNASLCWQACETHAVGIPYRPPHHSMKEIAQELLLYLISIPFKPTPSFNSISRMCECLCSCS